MLVEPTWTEARLLDMVSARVQESLTLDYKACAALGVSDSKKNEISKDVSAFANSAGGVIVYGVLENGHYPLRLDIGFSREEISKEWLEQVINSRIQRRISGVRVAQVELTTSAPDRVVYVVEIPQSPLAPHQAADKRFYKRFNFESVPMEEYEVRDVAGRQSTPDLRINIAINRVSSSNPPDPTPTFELVPSIFNDAATPAEHAVIHLYVDKRIGLTQGHAGLKAVGQVALRTDGLQALTSVLHINWGVPSKMPIFFGSPFMISDTPLQVDLPDGSPCLVGWKIVSPHMRAKSGVFYVTRRGDVIETECFFADDSHEKLGI